MRILHVVDNVSRTHGGGVAMVVSQLARAQAQLGHKVTIYSTDYQANGQQPPEGVELKTFKSYGHLKVTPGMMLSNFNHFDVLHMHNYRTLINLIAAGAGRPFVLQAHGNAQPPGGNWKFKMLNKVFFETMLLNRSSLLLADAEPEIEQYQKQGVPLSRIKLVDMGIDLTEYANLPPRKNGKIKTILYLAKYHEIKGPDILVKAFKYLKRSDVRLVMYGWDDGFRQGLEGIIKTMGLSNVEVNGFISGPEKIQAMVDADVWVCPSRYEMFGLGILEACACGTPVIISDKCAIAKRIPEQCGMVTKLTAFDLASTIKEMLDRDYSNSFRDYRREWASKFSWDKIAKQVIKLYEGII